MIDNMVAGIIGFGMLAAFLGIMLWWVKAVPLIVIVIVVLAMVVYDFVQTLRFGEDYAKR